MDAFDWPVQRLAGSADVFGREPAFPSIAVVSVDQPLLVLGSTQPDDVVHDADGVPVTRRRSGGGAVLLEPGRVVWVDVAVPAAHRLWDGDVGRAFHWLGAVWTDAIGARARWHNGPLVRGPFSDLVCFAGLGPGEVTIDGRKVVGMSQRRTRAGALFQCAALVDWEPSRLAAMLDVGVAPLADIAVGLTPMTVADVETAFLAALADALAALVS